MGQKDPLESEMATHCNILVWEIQGQRSLVGYSPWDCKELNVIEHTQRQPILVFIKV